MNLFEHNLRLTNESIVHTLDPRVKIFFTVALSLTVFMVRNFYGLLFVLITFSIAYWISKVSIARAFRALRSLIYIFIFSLLFHSLGGAYSQNNISLLGFINLSLEGLTQGIFFTSRMAILVFGTALLSLTTTPTQLVNGFENILSLGGNLKALSHRTAMVLGIAIGFLPSLMINSEKIMLAQRSRGADFTSENIVKRIKGYFSLVLPIFASSVRRAENLSEALESRCYNGFRGRTRLNNLDLERDDWLALGILLIIISVAVYIGN